MIYFDREGCPISDPAIPSGKIVIEVEESCPAYTIFEIGIDGDIDVRDDKVFAFGADLADFSRHEPVNAKIFPEEIIDSVESTGSTECADVIFAVIDVDEIQMFDTIQHGAVCCAVTPIDIQVVSFGDQTESIVLDAIQCQPRAAGMFPITDDDILEGLSDAHFKKQVDAGDFLDVFGQFPGGILGGWRGCPVNDDIRNGFLAIDNEINAGKYTCA